MRIFNRIPRFCLSVDHILLFALLIHTVTAEVPTEHNDKPEHESTDINLSLENVPQVENTFKSSQDTGFGDKVNFWKFKPLNGPVQGDASISKLRENDVFEKKGEDGKDIERVITKLNPEDQTPATDRTLKLFKAIGRALDKRPFIPIYKTKAKIYPKKPAHEGEGSHYPGHDHNEGWGRRPGKRPCRKPKWGRRPSRCRKRKPGKDEPVYDGVKVYYKGPNYDGDGNPISNHHFSPSYPKFRGPKPHKRRRPFWKLLGYKRRHRYRHRRPHHHDDHDDHDDHQDHHHFPEHHNFEHPGNDDDHDHFDGPPDVSHNDDTIPPFGTNGHGFNTDDGPEHSDHSDVGKGPRGFKSPFWRRPKPHHNNEAHDNGPGFNHGPEGHPGHFPASFNDGSSPHDAPRKPFRRPKPGFGPPLHNGFSQDPEGNQDHFPNDFNDGPSQNDGPPRKPFRHPKPGFGPPEHGSPGFDQGPEEHFSNDFNDGSSPHDAPQQPFRRPKPSFSPPQYDGHDFNQDHEDNQNDFSNDFNNGPSQTPRPRRKPFRRPSFSSPQHDGPGFDQGSDNNEDHFNEEPSPTLGPTADHPSNHNQDSGYHHGPEHHPHHFPDSINDQLSPGHRAPRRPFRRPQRPEYYDPPGHDSPQHTESAEHSSDHFEKPPGNFKPKRRPYSYKHLGYHRPHHNAGHHSNYYRRPNGPFHSPRRPYHRRPRPIYPPPHHDHPIIQGHDEGPLSKPYSFRPSQQNIPPPPNYHQQSQGFSENLHSKPSPAYDAPRRPHAIRPRPIYVPPKEPEVIYGTPMSPAGNQPSHPSDHPNTAYGSPNKLRLPIPFKPLPDQNSQTQGNNLHHTNFIDQSNKPEGSGSQEKPQSPGMSQMIFNQVKSLVYKLSMARNNTNQNQVFKPSTPITHGNSIQAIINNKPHRNPHKYSTLPVSMAQYKPDPTHETLPKLTYDSMRSGSHYQSHIDPGQGMRNVPPRQVSKFTSSDAIVHPSLQLQKRMTSHEDEIDNVKSEEKELDLKLKPQRGFQDMIKAHAKFM